MSGRAGNHRYMPRYGEDDWNLRITDTQEDDLHWPLKVGGVSVLINKLPPAR